jgi:integrase
VDFPLPAEIKRIVDAAQGRGRALLIVAAFAGLRASELRGLRWSDVELTGKEPKIHVRQRADRYGEIGNPKSEAGERDVPVGPMVVNMLKEWRVAQGRCDLVFANGAGNVENHSNLVQRVLQPMQVAAGITADGRRDKPRYTGLHALRHFYASWLINRRQNGGLELPLKEVQHRLGHATLAMTADTYGHMFPRVDHTAEIAAAERALFGIA